MLRLSGIKNKLSEITCAQEHTRLTMMQLALVMMRRIDVKVMGKSGALKRIHFEPEVDNIFRALFDTTQNYRIDIPPIDHALIFRI